MEIIRKTTSRCHVCAKQVEGAVVVSEGKAYLRRECPEHGEFQLLLSEHGKEYADLDRFYTEVHETSSLGRTMHTWVFATMDCQQKCPFCCTDCSDEKRSDSPWEELTWEDLQAVLKDFKRGKISFGGGEPTLHPNVLDFFREADRMGIAAQLATNGLFLASKDYCQKLKDNKVKEVRISLESIDPKDAVKLGLDPYVEPKLKAIQNLCDIGGIGITLSPTICRGVNEEQIYHIIEYAKDKPAIQAFSMQGFAWTGCGIGLPKDMMMTPDEMMDVIHRHYCSCDRSEVFALQKLAFAWLNIIGFKSCLKSEFMIFVRDAGRLRPITEFINLRRLDTMLNWWRRVLPKQRWLRGLFLIPVLIGGMSLKTLPLAPMFIKLAWANLTKLSVQDYPARLLSVGLNTNCSSLNADHTVNAHCVSGCIFKRDGVLHLTNTSTELLKNLENKC